MSFNDQVEFSMVPGKGRLLNHHIVRSKSRRSINILKSAAVYGANASGKSNLIKSMSFARKLIVKGTEINSKIPINNFRLNFDNYNKPSKFQFDIKCKNKFYSYGFSVDSNKVHEELLYEINKFKSKLLFHRITKSENEIIVNFGKISALNSSKEKQFLDFVAKGTRANQLFLTESIQRNVKLFADVYDWFRRILYIIFPETKYRGIELYLDKEEDFRRNLLELLQKFDTGIFDIKCEKYDIERELKEIPTHIISNLKKDIMTKDTKIMLSSSENRRYFIYRDEKDVIMASKLMTKHKIKNSDELASFEINEESDGTQRIIDLLPALIKLRNSDNVFIIDEIDRSLHPLLIIKFLEFFLMAPSNSNSQLIVTTHDTNLLNLNILRKDEIWFIEKNKDGESDLYSLEEFKPRYDRDIRKGYILGRFGAIPMIEK
jgi:hypothetical protein